MEDFKWYHGLIILVVLAIIAFYALCIYQASVQYNQKQQSIGETRKAEHQTLHDDFIRSEQFADKLASEGRLDYNTLSTLRSLSREFWIEEGRSQCH